LIILEQLISAVFTNFFDDRIYHQ